MAVRTFCDKCKEETDGVARYTVSVHKTGIPKTPSVTQPFMICGDGIVYHGPETQALVELCENCSSKWMAKVLEALKI